jgi:acyl carrier protein
MRSTAPSTTDTEEPFFPAGDDSASPAAAPADPDLSEAVRKVIADYLDLPIESLRKERSLRELGADSLDFIEILFELEEKFGIEAEEEISELRRKIVRLGDVIRLVEDLVAEKAAAGSPAAAAPGESGQA